MRGLGSNAVRGITLVLMLSFAASCGSNAPPSTGTGPAGALGISGDSLHKLAANAALWPVEQSAERKCEGGIGSLCWAPFGLGRKVKVNIYADTGARNTSPNPAASGATLVGKFENTGKYAERQYNLTSGPYDFLLFVFPVTGGNEGRWVIERVSKAPAGGTYQHATVSEGRYRGCGHPTTTYSKSFGDFRTCAMGPPPPPPGVTRHGARAQAAPMTAGLAAFSLMKAIVLLASEADDPAWFTCKSGCCVADPQ